MKNNQIFVITLLICLSGQFSYAQLTIESCWKLAADNYPLIRQHRLIEQTQNYNLSNASKGYLPQLSFSAKATYQSDVTSVPISVPGVTLKGLSKDQYQSVVQVDQVVWDGRQIQSQRLQTIAESNVQVKQLEVNLYSLNQRVNALFFGILLLDEQLRSNELFNDDLQRNFLVVQTRVKNGIANTSDLDAVKVELLNNKQRREALLSNSRAYRSMLSLMIGQTVDHNTVLIKPSMTNSVELAQINRPELALFSAQRLKYDDQQSLIRSKNMPRIGFFMQGGIGNPGLNMLKSDLSAFYIVGLSMSWNFGNLYTRSNELKQIILGKQNVNLQEEVFLWNLKQQTTQQSEEIEKLRKIMCDDDEVISLRKNIAQAAYAKMQNGTLSVSDYMREMNALELARQQKITHQIECLMSVYALKASLNN